MFRSSRRASRRFPGGARDGARTEATRRRISRAGRALASRHLEFHSMRDKPVVSRRSFLETAGVATGAAMAAGAFPHPAVGSVKGANEKLNLAILGPGGRAQEHLRI